METRKDARQAPPAPPGEAGHPALDTQGIRAIAARGDPVTPEQVLALCEQLEAAERRATQWRRQASLWGENVEDLIRERDGLRGRVGALEEAARPLVEYAAAHYQQAAIADQVGYHLPTDDDYPIEVPLGLLVSLGRVACGRPEQPVGGGVGCFNCGCPRLGRGD